MSAFSLWFTSLSADSSICSSFFRCGFWPYDRWRIPNFRFFFCSQDCFDPLSGGAYLIFVLLFTGLFWSFVRWCIPSFCFFVHRIIWPYDWWHIPNLCPFLFTGLFCPMTGGAYLIFAFSFTGLFDPLTGGASLIFAYLFTGLFWSFVRWRIPNFCPFVHRIVMILCQVAHTFFSLFVHRFLWPMTGGASLIFAYLFTGLFWSFVR